MKRKTDKYSRIEKEQRTIGIVCDACDCICVTDQRSTHRTSYKRKENKETKDKLLIFYHVERPSNVNTEAGQGASFLILAFDTVFLPLNEFFVVYEIYHPCTQQSLQFAFQLDRTLLLSLLCGLNYYFGIANII